MTEISTRRATRADTAEMASLLNEIILTGGTTALTTKVSADTLWGRIQSDPDKSAWHVATDTSGAVLGFQWIAPHDQLPPEAADIATFVRQGRTGLGIGSVLFRATAAAGKAMGYVWLNATIRADNTGGLVYYQSRGFRDWHHETCVTLTDGTVVDKISKRYDI